MLSAELRTIQFKTLMTCTRQELNEFMEAMFGEDGDSWDVKHDLVSDIVGAGRGQECIEYLS